MKFRFFFLGVLLFTLFGCCKECKKELEIAKQNLESCTKELDEIKTQKHVLTIDIDDVEDSTPSNNGDYGGICSDEAVNEKLSVYYPNQKKAKLLIPVPHKFSKPHLIKSTRNSLTFKTSGNNVVKKYKTYKVKVDNSLFDSENLTINLIIDYDNNNGCDDKPMPLPEKHKTSIVLGTDGGMISNQD